MHDAQPALPPPYSVPATDDALVRALFALNGVGVILTEPATGRFLRVNGKFCEFTGYEEEELLQTTCASISHPDDLDRDRDFRKEIRAGTRDDVQLEKRYVRKDGRASWAQLNTRVLRDEKGQPRHALAIVVDVDHDKRAALALRQSEERLALAMQAGRLGTYDLNLETGEMFISRELRALVGLPPDAHVTFDADLCPLYVHQEDRPRVAEAMRTCMNPNAYADFQQEYRIVRPDGQVRWVMDKGHCYFTEEGGQRRFARASGVCRDITEHKQTEMALREAHRRKDEFLATLAHELRNPLAPIRTSADIVRMNAGANSRLRWAAEVVTRQIEHLDHLVGDLLDLSRIATGKVSLNLERGDLRTVVWRAVEMNRRAIDAKGQQLRVELPDEPIPLHGDIGRLVQVVSNLLTNAIKYTPGGGGIHVSCRVRGSHAVLQVKDTGVGIKPELLPHVFDLFVQGERTLARAEGGLGIGLTLVRRIAELHGGSVGATSEGLNKGAEFTVSLPLAEAAPDTTPKVREAPSATGRGKRILIVEDNRDAADALAFLLADLGHEVRTVYEGHDGLKQALEFLPEIAILDIGLPGLSGYELARLLRQEPRLRGTLLIACSGYGRPADREQSRLSGFDHHLLKPFELNELTRLLETKEPAAS